MANGYTYRVEDGEITSLRDFALFCARAFGAAITMRDEPLSTPLPKAFEPDNYYLNVLEAEKKNLDYLYSLTPEERIEKAKEVYVRDMAGYRESIEKRIKPCSGTMLCAKKLRLGYHLLRSMKGLRLL